MAVLGKRKASEPSISEEEANEIFRRHFESRFAPLPESAKVSKNEDEASNDSDDDAASDGSEDEWGGISDDNDDDQDDDKNLDDDDKDEASTVQIVDHSSPQLPKPALTKRELKAILSSRPLDPTATPSDIPQQTKTSKTPAMPEDAPSLLKQDLELRRLISESHLLSSHRGNASVFSATALGATAEPKTFATGRTRQKATDLRVQALGSKASILKQDKMPMHMRKGMAAAASARESKRRREAKENGVILERATGGKKSNRRDKPRERAVDAPGMGRFKGAELRLNKNDIKKLEGSKDTFGRRSRR